MHVFLQIVNINQLLSFPRSISVREKSKQILGCSKFFHDKI